MAEEEINSFDDFEHYLNTTIKGWEPDQRMAFTAAMAERWLPVYEAFSEREEWGDPENLRRVLEAVWKHLGGQQLSSSDISRYAAQVDDSTPHMDDFDDVSALAACVMVKEALLCCRNPGDHVPAIQSAMSGFEAVVPFWDMEIAEHPQLWQQIKVRREYLKQLKLFEEIKAIKQFDEAGIAGLREKVRSKEFIEEAEPEQPTEGGPHTITNQRAFEQYRGIIELDIRSDRVDRWEEKAEPGSYMWALRLFATWSARYSRRYSIICGEYGRLADTTGQAALVARQRKLDGKVTAIPDWGSELNKVMHMALERDTFGFDIKAIDQPHSHGPSMRRLWMEGEQAGLPTGEAWRHILTWARHRPDAWEKEDQRKKQGRVYTTPEMGGLLALEVRWDDTGNPEHPWAAEVEGEKWQVRLNDFPDDFMYSLITDERDAGDFHDWPEGWKRG